MSATRYSLETLLKDINYISKNMSKETSTFRRSGIPLEYLLKDINDISNSGGQSK